MAVSYKVVINKTSYFVFVGDDVWI